MRLRGVDRKHCFQLQQFARCSLHVVRTHRFQFWLDERRCGSGSGQSVIHSVPVTARFPLSTSRFSPMPTEMSAQQMPFSEGYIECGDGCLYLRLLGSWSRRRAQRRRRWTTTNEPGSLARCCLYLRLLGSSSCAAAAAATSAVDDDERTWLLLLGVSIEFPKSTGKGGKKEPKQT